MSVSVIQGGNAAGSVKEAPSRGTIPAESPPPADGLAFQAFSAEYITNILETRARALPEPGPLQLTRRHDLLDIDIAPPDLNAYEVNDHDPE